MKEQFKRTGLPFLMLYCIALVSALIARVGIDIMAQAGTFTFNYKSATAPFAMSGPLLDQICGTLTGGTLVAFMFASGLVLALAVASVLLFARLMAGTSSRDSAVQIEGLSSAPTAHAGCAAASGSIKGEEKSLVPCALVWGIATVVVSIACLLVVVLGSFSAVQLSQMTSKLSGGALMALAGLLFVLATGTLVAAASIVLCRSAILGQDSRNIAFKALRSAIVCGLIVAALTACTYTPIAQATLDAAGLALWLGIDTLANVAIIAVASRSIGAHAVRR